VQATSQTYFKILFQYLPKEEWDNTKILRHDSRYKALNEMSAGQYNMTSISAML
jgi:hypothetical protein